MYLRLWLIIVNYSGASPCKKRCIFVHLLFQASALVLNTLYDWENKRSGISNETICIKSCLKIQKLPLTPKTWWKIIGAGHLCTTRKLFMEFTFRKGGENSVDNFKSSGTPSSSIQKCASRNQWEWLSTIKDAVMYSRGMSGENANKYGALRNVLRQPRGNVSIFSSS